MPNKKQKSDVKKLCLRVDPDQGLAALVAGIVPEDGYVFDRLDRKGNKAVVTFRKDLTKGR